jgi:hypothetical protein
MRKCGKMLENSTMGWKWMEWDSRVAWHGAIDGFWPAKVIRQWVIDKLPNDQANGIGYSKGAEIFREVVTSQSWICWLFVVRKMDENGRCIKIIKHHGISNWWTNGPWFSGPSRRSPPDVSRGVHRQCPHFEQLASMASDDWPSDSGPKLMDLPSGNLT